MGISQTNKHGGFPIILKGKTGRKSQKSIIHIFHLISNFRDSIRRFDYKNTVKVVSRGANVFLVKKSAWEKLSKEIEK